MKISNFVVLGALVSLLLVPGTADAQRGQGGQGGQRQGGFGGQRGGMMGGGMMGNNTLSLLQRADVQKDINLTDEQKKTLETEQTALNEKRQARFEEMRNGGGGGAGGFDRTAMEEMRAEMEKENDAIVNKVLNEEQQKRIKQISFQMRGMSVLTDAAVQKDLGLERTQVRKIEDLQQAQQEANMQLGQRMRNGEVDREEGMAIMEKNNKILNDEFAKVLTEEQTAKLKEMQGPEFKRDPKVDEAMRQNMGGRRGGGGGGGL